MKLAISPLPHRKHSSNPLSYCTPKFVQSTSHTPKAQEEEEEDELVTPTTMGKYVTNPQDKQIREALETQAQKEKGQISGLKTS